MLSRRVIGAMAGGAAVIGALGGLIGSQLSSTSPIQASSPPQLVLSPGTSSRITCTGTGLSIAPIDPLNVQAGCEGTTEPPPTTSTIPPTTTTPPPDHPAILFAAVEQLGRPTPVTQQSALALARAVSILSAPPARARDYAPYWTAMKSTNSQLKGIIYINGSHNSKADFPEAFYAHNAAGSRIINPTYHTYLMDITPGSGWVQNVITESVAALSATHWDGIFLDSEGSGACEQGAVHPGTKLPWTIPDCLTATNTNSQQVQKATNGILIANGLADGTTFFRSSHALLPGITGGDAEEFPRNVAKDNVNMLQTASSVIMTNTKNDPADQWHRYTLALFSIGTNSEDVYQFVGTGTSDTSIPDIYTSQAQSLGTPTSSPVTSTYYWRDYTHGEVVANPSSSPVTVTFPRPLTNLDGKVVTSETLQPLSGDLLAG